MSSPRHNPTPSSQAPKPKSILKNPLDRRPSQPTVDVEDDGGAEAIDTVNSTGGQQANGLSWDESNIALHDFEKESTQRMKIDEPKTPFVRGSGLDDESGFDAFALDTNQSPSSNGNSSGSGSGDNRSSRPGPGERATSELEANTSANAMLGGIQRPSNSRSSSGADSAIGLDAADLAKAGDANMSTEATADASASTVTGQPSGNAALKARSQSRSPSFSLPSSGSSSRRASSRSNAAGGAEDLRSGVRQQQSAMDIDGESRSAGEEALAAGGDEEEEEEDAETRAQREAFAKRRNAHYGNEAEALKVAKALAAQEDEDEDGEEASERTGRGANGV